MELKDIENDLEYIRNDAEKRRLIIQQAVKFSGSQLALSTCTCISTNTISRWSSGLATPRNSGMLKVLEFLKELVDE